MSYKVARRQAGVESLGQERFAAIADWNGGLVAGGQSDNALSVEWIENQTGSGQ
jgi:hypothetical protein